MSTEATAPTETTAPAEPLTDDQIAEQWGDDADTEQVQPPASETASGEGTVSQADGEPEQEGETEEETQPDPYGEAPEFWSAERKALWAKITDPDVRAAIIEQDKERTDGISKKLMESAEQVKRAQADGERFTQERAQFGQFLEKVVPQWIQTFRGKWEGVDWQKMANDDPALYTRMTAQRDSELVVLQQAENARQQEARAAENRAQIEREAFRTSENQKLAKDLPAYFAPDKAQATFDELGAYLLKAGVPGERINSTVDSVSTTIALKAMLYDKAQAALKAKPTGQPTTATQTPRRVPPGARTGQPNRGEALRQAEQRLRTGQDLSDADVERLFG